jgi:uncharacterized membrane protein YcjF (UPF0283 family)
VTWPERHPILTVAGVLLALATAAAVVDWAAGSWARTALIIWACVVAVVVMVVHGGADNAAWERQMDALERVTERDEL